MPEPFGKILTASAEVLTTSGGKISNLRRVTFMVLDEAQMKTDEKDEQREERKRYKTSYI